MQNRRTRVLIAAGLVLACIVVPAVPALIRPVAPARAQAGRLVVDHTSVALFDRIPAEYIAAARNLRMIFLDKSVGDNISGGLTCLTGRGVASCGITGNQPYSRDNWTYQWFSESGCGAWSDLMTCFERQAHATIDSYDVLMFGHSYMEVDQAGALGYFDETSALYREASDYARFLAEHGKPVVWWTSSLNRGADADAEAWNELMRGYAAARGEPLFDLADILSHRPNGQPCTSLAGNYPAICYPDYTTQTTSGGGHLSKAGQAHVAKALWVLMAQLAGWMPDGAEPEPSATTTTIPSATPSPTPTDTPEPTATATSILQSPLPTPTSEPTDTPMPAVTATATPTDVPTATPIPAPTQPTVTPTFTPTPTPSATPVLCPFDGRTSATVGAALQLWLEAWPAAQRYRDAANGSGSIEPLTEAEVSALITACWTQANVSGAGYYRGDQ